MTNTSTLPPGRAFLVRLGSDADPGRGHLSGRVEHLQSGRRVRIASLDELQDFVAEVLGEESPGNARNTPMRPGPPRPEEES